MNKPYGLTKIREDKDGRKMLGGGCKTCPVTDCATSTYRGSACASLRATYGLGDPMTNADHIRSMSDEELAEHFALIAADTKSGTVYSDDEGRWLDWLAEPYKGW